MRIYHKVAELYDFTILTQSPLYDNGVKFILLFTLLSPILYQLFINWINSRVFEGYLRKKFGDEFKKYNRSIEGLLKRDKKLIDEIYKSVTEDFYFNDSRDITLTKANLIFLSRLEKATSPGIPTLLISYVKYYFRVRYDRLLLLLRKVKNYFFKKKYSPNPTNKISTPVTFYIGDSMAELDPSNSKGKEEANSRKNEKNKRSGKSRKKV
jgi:hypothetical protein